MLAELYLRSRTFNGYCVWPPRFSYTLTPKPGVLPGVKGDSRFTTNKFGIRARDFSWRDDYRILAIGGSTTECLFLDDTETWQYLLENRLQENLRSTRVWIGNIGKSGQTSVNHLEALEVLVPQLHSIDAVLMMVGINDMSLFLSQGHKSGAPGKSRLNNVQADKKTFLTEPEELEPFYRIPKIKERMKLLCRRLCECECSPDLDYLIDADGIAYQKWRNHRRFSKKKIKTMPNVQQALKNYRTNLLELIDLAEKQELRVVFATQPTLWHSRMSPPLKSLLWFGGIGPFQEKPGQPYYTNEVLADVMERYNQVLKNICVQRNIECIDLAAILPKDTTVFYDDCHFNENGARLLADAVARHFMATAPLDRNIDR